MPDAFESVARVPGAVLVRLIRFPAVPFRLKLLNVVVTAPGNATVAGCTVFVMLLNVFASSMLRVPAPPWFRVQLNVEPPPAKLFAALPVMEIVPVPVPAVVVKPVGATLLNAAGVFAGQTRVPPLNVRFLVPVAVVYDEPTVRVFPFRSIVPLVWVRVRLDPIVRASCSTQVPPTPLNVAGKVMVLPLEVIVLPVDVAAKTQAVAPDVNVAVEPKFRLP